MRGSDVRPLQEPGFEFHHAEGVIGAALAGEDLRGHPSGCRSMRGRPRSARSDSPGASCVQIFSQSQHEGAGSGIASAAPGWRRADLRGVHPQHLAEERNRKDIGS